MDIRLVDEFDMLELWKIWVRALHDHPEAFGPTYEWARDVSPERIQELLRQTQSGGGFTLGVFKAQTPVGMLNFNRLQGDKFHHKGYVGAVYVVPEERRNGVARMMLNTTLEHARAMTDLAVVGLSVNNENKSAIKLYEACGFKSYGVEPKGLCVNGQYYDLMHMSMEMG